MGHTIRPGTPAHTARSGRIDSPVTSWRTAKTEPAASEKKPAAGANAAAEISTKAKLAGAESRGSNDVRRRSDNATTSATATRVAQLKTAKTGPTPFPSRFGIAPKDQKPIKSFWDKAMKSGAEINGTFFMAIKDGVPHLQIPIVLTGQNRLTPEYYQKVVKPLQQAFAATGSPIEKLLDGTDYQPQAKDFEPGALQKYGESIKQELERLFGEIGVPTEVVLQYQDVALSKAEQKALTTGKIEGDAEQLKGFVFEDMLRLGKSKSYRSKDYLTFMPAPFANVVHPYAQTEDFNPSIGQSVDVMSHELTHYLFADTYEGYYDPHAPPTAVMGDVAAQRRAHQLGQQLHFSPAEKALVYDRLLAVAKTSKLKDTAKLQQALKAAEAERAAQEQRSKPGKISVDGTIKLPKTGETVKLDPTEWKAFFDNADRKKPVLLNYDADNKLIAVNAQHKRSELGYVRFMGNEVGLTYMYIEGTIRELLDQT